MSRRDAGARGFSLLELMVSMGLVVTLASAVFALLGSSEHAFATGLEAADARQRLRVAATMLYRDLLHAGAGVSVGSRPGPLSQHVPSILPYRQDFKDGDRPGSFRRDAITVFYVPTTVAQSVVADRTPARGGWTTVASSPGCPVNDSACGFRAGMPIVIFDASGAADRFTVVAVDGARLLVDNEGEESAKVYEPGSPVAELVARTYFLKTDAASGLSQLMRGRASGGADVPAADHVVGLAFEYFGQPAAGGGVVRLESTALTDGPWLPDSVSPNRFDEDLLRVHSIEVTLRVQSASEALRGPAGELFSRGGTSRDSRRWMPDLEIRFRVSPRNLGVGSGGAGN